MPSGSGPQFRIVTGSTAIRRSSWRRTLDLFWSEWFAHSRLLLFFLALWLADVWFVPLFAHPFWILLIGPLFAIVAGPVFGGADVLQGCEEYFMSFPVTRNERFWTRAALGGFAVLILSVASALSLVSNLSDVLLRVFVDSGVPQPTVPQPGLLYGMISIVPITAFVLSFSVASLAPTRTLVLVSWLWGTLGSLAALRVGIYLEELRYEKFDGRLAIPLLIGVCVAVLTGGSRLYARKEAATSAVPLRISAAWWLWMLILVGACLAMGFLLEWFASNMMRLI